MEFILNSYQYICFITLCFSLSILTQTLGKFKDCSIKSPLENVSYVYATISILLERFRKTCVSIQQDTSLKAVFVVMMGQSKCYLVLLRWREIIALLSYFTNFTSCKNNFLFQLPLAVGCILAANGTGKARYLNGFNQSQRHIGEAE